jgi:2'-5' RNA ligase
MNSQKYEYCCLMASFDIENWTSVLALVDPNDILNTPGLGYETEPHVTILFGLHDEVPFEQIVRLTKSYKSPITAEITNLSFFENEEFDVLKFDIKSDDLQALHDVATVFPHTTTYPIYHPHMTLAYLKKGTARSYAKELKDPIQISSKEYIYSFTSGKKAKWTI